LHASPPSVRSFEGAENSHYRKDSDYPSVERENVQTAVKRASEKAPPTELSIEPDLAPDQRNRKGLEPRYSTRIGWHALLDLQRQYPRPLRIFVHVLIESTPGQASSGSLDFPCPFCRIPSFSFNLVGPVHTRFFFASYTFIGFVLSHRSFSGKFQYIPLDSSVPGKPGTVSKWRSNTKRSRL
jgi:hypothetical protein